MKAYKTIFLLLLTASLALAKNVGDIFNEARRMCVNDSIPQALLLLDKELTKETCSNKDAFLLHLEKGDILLYYARVPDKAAKIYDGLTKFKSTPKDSLPGVYYRLGLALERSEKFADAARAYEKVVTDFPKSPFNDFSFSAIERCFNKNYEIKVAEVNGYAISELAFDEALSKLTPSEKEKALTSQGREELIDTLIYERLLLKEAAKRFAKPYSAEISIKLSCMSCRSKKVKIPGGINDYFLETRLKAIPRSLLLRRLYKQEVLDRIKVNDREMKRYYKEHPEMYTVYGKYALQELVVDSLHTDSVKIALANGTPFDSLIAKYSIAPSKSKGGLVSDRPLHVLYKGMQPVAETLKVGTLSEPYLTERGWEIIKIKERNEDKLLPYEQVKASIEEYLRGKKMGEISEEALKRFRVQAGIDSTTSSDTLAKVAGKAIFPADIDNYITTMSMVREEQKSDPEFRKNVLKQIISEMVFDNELAKRKMFMNDTILSTIESRYNQTLVDFYFLREIDEKARPSDKEIEAYYKKNKKEFWNPTQLKIREILVSSKDTANMLYGLYTKGASFDSLAKVYSKAETSKRSGFVGYLTDGKSDKPYVRQLFKYATRIHSKKNDGPWFMKPVKTEEGYWLIKVERKQDAYQSTLPESISKIKLKLYNENKKRLETELRKRLLASASITIFEKKSEEPSSNELKTEPESPKTSKDASQE